MKEEACVFGKQGNLVGVITDPDLETGTQSRTAVILLNAGLVHRVGPYRLYVRLARQLAQMGLVALRFDFAGIGDSQATRSDRQNDQRAIEETRQAMDFLQERRGITQFVLIGICSGAVDSLQTAIRDRRVKGAVLINGRGPLTGGIEHAKQNSYYWKVALLNPSSWLRLISGKADYRAIGQTISSRLKTLFALQNKPPPQTNMLVGAIKELAKCKVRLLAVYSVEDPGLDYLRLSFGRTLPALLRSGEIQLEIIPTRSHTFLLISSQQLLISVLADWLTANIFGLAAVENS